MTKFVIECEEENEGVFNIVTDIVHKFGRSGLRPSCNTQRLLNENDEGQTVRLGTHRLRPHRPLVSESENQEQNADIFNEIDETDGRVRECQGSEAVHSIISSDFNETVDSGELETVTGVSALRGNAGNDALGPTSSRTGDEFSRCF